MSSLKLITLKKIRKLRFSFMCVKLWLSVFSLGENRCASRSGSANPQVIQLTTI